MNAGNKSHRLGRFIRYLHKVLRIVPDDINFDFVRWGKIALWISGLLVCGSIFLILFNGLEFGTDFTGGVVVDFRLENGNVDDGIVKNVLSDAGLDGLSVQSLLGDDNKKEYMVVFRGDMDVENGFVDRVRAALGNLGEITYHRIDYVGAQVGLEQVREAIMAVLCALACMLVYLCVRFRWQFAVGGVIALVHDIVITIGMISATGLEFNLPAMSAILMIIGYSVNDSVVIYDRVRELMRNAREDEDMSCVVNQSINTTLSRTLLTSGTTLVASLPLILLCEGGAVRSIGIIAFFGIIVGTYSSIFVSTIPFVKSLEKARKEKIIGGVL